MKRTIITIVGTGALALAVGGCSKDTGHKDEGKAGMSAKSAAEFGPQRTAKAVEPQEITVTSKSPEAIELFREGRDLHENFRTALAKKKLSRAIELDPDFALAHAYLAMAKDGDRKDAMEKAVALAKDAPLAERLVIKGFQQQFSGDRAAAAETHKKLTEQAPGDWRAHYWLGLDQQAAGEEDAAAASLEKAIALNPKAAAPYNNLAYLYANQGKYDKAIDTVENYVALKPGEPNPLDSKAEIMMMAGKLEAAERSFEKAAATSSDFYIANTGLAAARMHRGDWSGGIDALNAYVAAAQSPWEVQKGRTELAWAKLGADDLEGAIAMTEAVAQAGKDAGNESADVGATYLAAQLYLEAGEFKKAYKLADKALADENKPEWMDAWASIVKFRAAVGLDKMDAADKALATIDAAAAKAKESKHGKKGDSVANLAAYARGTLAFKNGDAAGAAEHFAALEGSGPLEYRGRWLQAKALAKAGKKAESEALRKTLAATYPRRAIDAYYRAKFLGSGQI